MGIFRKLIDSEYKELKKFEKIADQIIEKESEPESETLNFIALILKDMYFVLQNKQTLEIIFETIEKYKYKIFKTPNFKILRNIITESKDNLPEFDGKRNLLIYMFDINSELPNLQEKEAIVSHVKDTFGFVKNMEYPQGIYFSKFNLNFEPQYGDIVELGDVVEVKQGLTTLSITYKTNIADKYNF